MMGKCQTECTMLDTIVTCINLKVCQRQDLYLCMFGILYVLSVLIFNPIKSRPILTKLSPPLLERCQQKAKGNLTSDAQTTPWFGLSLLEVKPSDQGIDAPFRGQHLEKQREITLCTTRGRFCGTLNQKQWGSASCPRCDGLGRSNQY